MPEHPSTSNIIKHFMLFLSFKIQISENPSLVRLYVVINVLSQNFKWVGTVGLAIYWDYKYKYRRNIHAFEKYITFVEFRPLSACTSTYILSVFPSKQSILFCFSRYRRYWVIGHQIPREVPIFVNFLFNILLLKLRNQVK